MRMRRVSVPYPRAESGDGQRTRMHVCTSQPQGKRTVADGEVRGFHVSVDIAAEPRRGACRRDVIIDGARGERTRNAPARVHSLQRVQHLHADLNRNPPAA